jgi:hypothetical protein
MSKYHVGNALIKSKRKNQLSNIEFLDYSQYSEAKGTHSKARQTTQRKQQSVSIAAEKG